LLLFSLIQKRSLFRTMVCVWDPKGIPSSAEHTKIEMREEKGKNNR
jgi:hypothetical protein